MPSSLTRVLPFVSGFSPRPPASVSGTGTFGYTSSFSRQRELIRFPTSISVHITPQLTGVRTSLYPNLDACTELTITPLGLSFCVTASFLGGAGIYTCCPSPTTAVLGLGPDLPWVDEPSPGNLGLSTGMFLACLSLLIPAFSLVCSPHVLSVVLQPRTHCSSTARLHAPIASASRLSPGHLRRTITRPVSYYALFKCVAASEPTSWLSVQFHILLHLTCTWGP